MSDSALIRSAVKGDKQSFAALIKDCEASMYRISKAIVKNDDDCLDAIQTTVMKAYEGIVKLRLHDYFETWLMRILINECNGILRAKRKEIRLNSGIINECDVYYTFDEVENLDLKAALNSLDIELHMVVILYYFENLPLKQVAAITGIPEGTVKSRLSRARAILHGKLKVVEGGCFCE